MEDYIEENLNGGKAEKPREFTASEIFIHQIQKALEEYNISKEKEISAEFAEAFHTLRTQFNEMQLFSGKSNFVLKILMAKNWTNEEKIDIAAKFDAAGDFLEAKKLYEEIIKTNK